MQQRDAELGPRQHQPGEPGRQLLDLDHEGAQRLLVRPQRGRHVVLVAALALAALAALAPQRPPVRRQLPRQHVRPDQAQRRAHARGRAGHVPGVAGEGDAAAHDVLELDLGEREGVEVVGLVEPAQDAVHQVRRAGGLAGGGVPEQLRPGLLLLRGGPLPPRQHRHLVFLALVLAVAGRRPDHQVRPRQDAGPARARYDHPPARRVPRPRVPGLVLAPGRDAVESRVHAEVVDRGVARLLAEDLLPRPRLLPVGADDEVVAAAVPAVERDLDAGGVRRPVAAVLRYLDHGRPEHVPDVALPPPGPRLLALLQAGPVQDLDDVPPHELVLAREGLRALARVVRGQKRGPPAAPPVQHVDAALGHALGPDGVEEPQPPHQRDPLRAEVDLLPLGAQRGGPLYHRDSVVRVGSQQHEGRGRAADARANDEDVERHCAIKLFRIVLSRWIMISMLVCFVCFAVSNHRYDAHHALFILFTPRPCNSPKVPSMLPKWWQKEQILGHSGCECAEDSSAAMTTCSMVVCIGSLIPCEV